MSTGQQLSTRGSSRAARLEVSDGMIGPTLARELDETCGRILQALYLDCSDDGATTEMLSRRLGLSEYTVGLRLNVLRRLELVSVDDDGRYHRGLAEPVLGVVG